MNIKSCVCFIDHLWHNDVPRDCQILLGEFWGSARKVFFGQPQLPLWDMLWMWYRIPNTMRSLNQNVKQEIDTFVLFIPIWQIPTLLTLFYNFISFYAPYFLVFRSFPKPLDGYPNHWMVSFHWEPILPHEESWMPTKSFLSWWNVEFTIDSKRLKYLNCIYKIL